MKKKKILITGAAGYIGSVLTGRLLKEGYSVTAFDNLMYGQQSLIQYCYNKNFNFINGDVRNRELLKKLIDKTDIIIPLAAIVGAPACKNKPLDAKTVNLEAIKVLNKLRKKKPVIFPNTNSGYGTTSGKNFCTEKTPLKPISLYGKTKVAAEKALLKSSNVITLRLATVFGTSPRMRTDLLVNDFTFEATKRGFLVIYEKNFKRNYVHVRDVANCFAYCIKNFNKMKNETYNLGLDEANYSKKELAETIKKHVPSLKIYYEEFAKDPDKRNYIVSNKKLASKGFKAKIGLEQGIEELLKAYKMMPESNYKNVT